MNIISSRRLMKNFMCISEDIDQFKQIEQYFNDQKNI